MAKIGYDISGMIFGKLLVIKKSKFSGKGSRYVCRCECGKEKEVYRGHLLSGSVKTCGSCYTQLIDIVGKKFGLLEVISFQDVINKNSYWKCKCQCGNIISVSKSNLKAGNVRSCGCFSNKFQEQSNLEIYGTKSSFQNKLVQERFKQNNKIKYGVEYPAQVSEIALKTAKSSKHSSILYHWKNNKEIVCIASYEKKVIEYLNKNKIDYAWQESIFNVVVDGKNKTYRPDLYIINDDFWIEIKGYKRESGMKKWFYFHNFLHQNSELWDTEKLKNMRII